MINKKNITGIVLAGGKSTRMGTDKGFLLLKNKPFIHYSIDALKPLVSEILIVSDNPDYDTFGFKRVNDITKDAGPVSGIYSGLETSSTQYNLILSCDIPLITSEILKKLIECIDDTSDIIQIECKGKTMPLIALYKRQCMKVFNKLLQEDERRLRVVVSQCNVKNMPINIKEHYVTTNVNTKDEFKHLEDAYNN